MSDNGELFDEESDGPPSNVERSVMDGMTQAWRSVYDRFREGHAAAVFDAQDRPDNPEARAILYASSAGIRAFRAAYQKSATAGIAQQINRSLESD